MCCISVLSKLVVFIKQRLRLTVAFALSEMLAWRSLPVGVPVESFQEISA